MRSYFSAYRSPDGRTLSETDVWGNDDRVFVRHRKRGQGAIAAYNECSVGILGQVVTWRGIDASGNIVEEYPSTSFMTNLAWFGVGHYKDHPLN